MQDYGSIEPLPHDGSRLIALGILMRFNSEIIAFNLLDSCIANNLFKFQRIACTESIAGDIFMEIH